MIRRHREVLNYIFNSEGGINGTNLARMCGVSVRTIQLDIKDLNSLLNEYGIEIKTIVKQGYYLDDKGKALLKEKSFIREIIDYEYINDPPILPFERQMYIVLKLTMKKIIYFNELEDKLYVSESTLNKDIIAAAKWLNENLNIKMNYSLSKKVELKINEIEKRNIFSWVLSYKLNASTLEKQWKYIFDSNGFIDTLRKIYPITEVEAIHYGYYLSGHSLQMLGVEIIIALTLGSMGSDLEKIQEENILLKPVISAIREKLEKNLNIILSDREWVSIQEYFLSKQFISGTNIENIETEESIELVTDFLIVLTRKYEVDLIGNSEFKEKLILYVAPMLHRLKFKHSIGNKINENVKQIHPLEFKMASEMAVLVKEKYNMRVPEDELAYIAVHLAAIYKKWCQKLNSVIVCDYDESIISYIKSRILNQFEDRIKVVSCITFRQLISGKTEVFKDVDFIITTSSVADKTNLPFVQVSPVMDQKDFDKLFDQIIYFNQK